MDAKKFVPTDYVNNGHNVMRTVNCLVTGVLAEHLSEMACEDGCRVDELCGSILAEYATYRHRRLMSPQQSLAIATEVCEAASEVEQLGRKYQVASACQAIGIDEKFNHAMGWLFSLAEHKAALVGRLREMPPTEDPKKSDSTTYNVYAFAGNSEMLRGENLSEQAAKECYFTLLEEGYPSNYIIVKPPHPYIPSN